MKPDDVPNELVNLATMVRLEHNPDGSREELARFLAAVLPAHEAMVRAKVAEELRADARALAQPPYTEAGTFPMSSDLGGPDEPRTFEQLLADPWEQYDVNNELTPALLAWGAEPGAHPHSDEQSGDREPSRAASIGCAAALLLGVVLLMIAAHTLQVM